MFIVIDGPNGSGKTTLINKLKANGNITLSSPKETPLSTMLRPACRGTSPWEDIDPRIQFMLFSAARFDEYVRIVMPAPYSEKIYADRWWTSTYVYQCMLQGISVDFMEHTIHPQEQLDLVLLLDADNEVLSKRLLVERDINPAHGKCSWTKEMDTVYRLADMYRNELRHYLTSKGICNLRVDVTNSTTDEVYNHVLETVEAISLKGVV